MSQERLAEILKLYDPPPGTKLWHGGATAMGALRGMPPEEAAWKPAPDRHSIWELVLHIAYWKYVVQRRITSGEKGAFPRSPSNFPAVPDPPDATAWKRDRALLKTTHLELVEVMKAFDPKRLDEMPPEGTYSYADLMTGIVLHDTYHAGQIQIMKRLHKSLEG